jgi:SAM-dependent methyltransferase
MEILDVPSAKGIPLELFVRESGVHGTGVEPDPGLLAQAEAHAKEAELTPQLSFQEGSPGDLPFRDETFDVVVGEVGIAAEVDPDQAIGELVRVARPGGRVVLIQLVWKAPVDEARKEVLAHHLGARPLMAVEIRRILMDAGVGELNMEDWTDEDTAFRQRVKKPFPDFTELFTLSEKLGILRRAWRRWGWRGVRALFQREAEVHRLLTKERILGLNLILGVKAPAPASPEKDAREGESGSRDGDTHQLELGDTESEEGPETSGLPLFGAEAENGG